MQHDPESHTHRYRDSGEWVYICMYVVARWARIAMAK